MSRLDAQLTVKDQELATITQKEAKAKAASAFKAHIENLQQERDEFQRMVMGNQKERHPRGTWNGKKADNDFYKMIVDSYEVKKQELMAKNEQLRALLYSMKVTDMVTINNVLGSWGVVRLKLYNLLLKVVQYDRPIVCEPTWETS
ncbi:hypothetical protein GIB67_026238, partial [Kingdonia uniflora]